MATDPSSAIQQAIDSAVSDHMGMAVYVVTDFGSGTPTAKFFCPSQLEVWDSNHKAVAAADMPTLLFEIASISKVFTSRIFLGLQGLFAGKTIADCMPAITLPTSIGNIAVADIAAYASGFPQDNGLPPDPRGPFCPASNQQSFATLVQWFRSGQNADWICPAGHCYTYSNLGWSLLAIAALAPKDTSVDVYGGYQAELYALCENLGMSDSTALFEHSQVAKMACGYSGTPPKPFGLGQNYQPSPPMRFGSGSIVSCADDMLQWLLYNMGRSRASQDDFPLLNLQQTPRQLVLKKCGTTTGVCGASQPAGPMTGFGWFFPKIGGKAGPVVAKDGGVTGFSSWMGFQSWVGNGIDAPSEKGVVVLAAGQMASPVGQKIIGLLLGDVVEDLRTGGLPSAEG